MSAIGKVQASIASGSQETTLALANLNFDFSLVKIEAPPEYKELGMALAETRRSAAEHGPVHTTARRLGSLFQSILPETPRLFRAYGQRASDIAKDPDVNPKGSKADGAFQEFIGVDGTAIWAAATSGSASIAAHLLACMLATAWEAKEAVAIWVELVEERKKRLAETVSDKEFFRLDDAVASQLSLDQAQLAMWDSSARAWLRASEDAAVVKPRQTALKAALRGINATVNGHESLYTSIVEAWKLALTTFEGIVNGTGYSITEGSVLLALLSWRLFPDLVVLGSQPQELRQKDPVLGPGALVTVGLLGKDPSATNGVYWSLSLAHLSYYGSSRRVTSLTGLTEEEDNRLTLANFVLVIIGAIVGLWSDEDNITTEDALEFTALVVSKLQEGLEAGNGRVSWDHRASFVKHFAEALCVKEGEKRPPEDQRRKLINLGIRYRKVFTPNRQPSSGPWLPRPGQELSRTGQQGPAGADKKRSLFRLLGLDGVCLGSVYAEQEERLAYFRVIARKLAKPSPQTGVQLKHCYLLLFKHTKGELKSFFYSPHLGDGGRSNSVEEVGVLLKSYYITNAKSPNGTKTLYWRHTPASIRTTLENLGVLRVERGDAIGGEPYTHGWVFHQVTGAPDEEFLLFRSELNELHASSNNIQFRPGGRAPPPPGASFHPGVYHSGPGVRPGYYGSATGPGVRPRFLAAPPPTTKAVYLKNEAFQHSKDEISRILGSAKMSPKRFRAIFFKTYLYKTYFVKLSYFLKLYDGLHGAKISPNILKSPTCNFWDLLPQSILPVTLRGPMVEHADTLSSSSELGFSGSSDSTASGSAASELKHRKKREVFREHLEWAFRVIATLETGQDLFLRTQPNKNLMGRVFAISVEDSLYIASPLLCDPMTGFSNLPEIRRVRGNVGRTGLTLLGFFSPFGTVSVREKDPGKWKQINHCEFDGKLEDCFARTSLHIRLSGYVQDIWLEGSSRFSGLSFAEAVLSSHDSGRWVADLDVLHGGNMQRFKIIRAREECPGCCTVGEPVDTQLLTVENWEELLDLPETPVVFKAHGNWQARLAAVAICLREGHTTLLFGSHGCWDCAFDELYEMVPDIKLRPTRGQSPNPIESADFSFDDANMERLAVSEKSELLGHWLSPEPPILEESVSSDCDDHSTRSKPDLEGDTAEVVSKPDFMHHKKTGGQLGEVVAPDVEILAEEQSSKNGSEEQGHQVGRNLSRRSSFASSSSGPYKGNSGGNRAVVFIL